MRFSGYNFVLLCLFLASCKQVDEADLVHLNGTWEIQEVRFPDGTKRQYTASTTVDFFELDPADKMGFRKKLQPQLDGSFHTSDDALPLECIYREDRPFLRFKGEPEAWEEEIIELGRERLITRRPDGVTYVYKRYEPLNLQ